MQTYMTFFDGIVIILKRERGEVTIGRFLHWSQKFHDNVFLFVGLTALGTFDLIVQ